MPARPTGADLLDLGLPCAVAAAAALATWLPTGPLQPLRMVLAMAVLFFVPGHLLLAATTRGPTLAGQRPTRALVALGVSPALVGVLALATTLTPWGFQPGSIVVAVTVACFALAGVAAYRRRAPGPRVAGPVALVRDLDLEAEGMAN